MLYRLRPNSLIRVVCKKECHELHRKHAIIHGLYYNEVCHCTLTVAPIMGGNLSPPGCLPLVISLIFPRSRLISNFCISMILESSEGSTLAIPVLGGGGLELDRAAWSLKPCLRAILRAASRSCDRVRLFFSSVRRSLISFSRETFSYKFEIEKRL